MGIQGARSSGVVSPRVVCGAGKRGEGQVLLGPWAWDPADRTSKEGLRLDVAANRGRAVSPRPHLFEKVKGLCWSLLDIVNTDPRGQTCPPPFQADR